MNVSSYSPTYRLFTNGVGQTTSGTNLTTEMTKGFTDHCAPLRENFLQAVCVLPALVALENLIFLLAMTLHRRKLKHHTVYRYVASALVANCVVSVLGFYHFLNYYYGFEPYEPNLWWALRKGMTLSLSLIMCGNIGLLIYGIDDNTYIVGRITKPSQQAENLSPKYKRRKANILIAIVWILPAIYGALSMAPWNCTWECTCTLSYESNRPICPGTSCSRLFTPMAKSYLFVIVILWALECSGLLFLFGKSIHALRQSSGLAAASGAKERSLVSKKQTFVKWRENYGVLFLLFAFFLLCTIPVMVLGVLDFAFPQMTLSKQVVNFVTPLPLVYSLVSPIFIAHKLSGIKNSLMNLIALVCSRMQTKTQATNKNGNTVATANCISKDSSLDMSCKTV